MLVVPRSRDAPPASASTSSTGMVAQLPLLEGWFEGTRAEYITTDVSDFEGAAKMHANHAPRLAGALSDGPIRPGRRAPSECGRRRDLDRAPGSARVSGA